MFPPESEKELINIEWSTITVNGYRHEIEVDVSSIPESANYVLEWQLKRNAISEIRDAEVVVNGALVPGDAILVEVDEESGHVEYLRVVRRSAFARDYGEYGQGVILYTLVLESDD